MQANYNEHLSGIVDEFYRSFAALNASKMNEHYAEDIIFFDPVFGLLKGEEVKGMWKMLCENAKDFSLSHHNIKKLDNEYFTCEWEATYTFSKTGRKIKNKVKANMRIVNGLIIEHSDAFSLHEWSKQAFGFSGWLFGWNSYFQNKIKNSAKKSLLRYLKSQK